MKPILTILSFLFGVFSIPPEPSLNQRQLKEYFWNLPIEGNYSELLRSARNLELDRNNSTDTSISGFLKQNNSFNYPAKIYQLEIHKDEFWISERLDSNTFGEYLYSEKIIFINLHANYLKSDTTTIKEQFRLIDQLLRNHHERIDSLYLLPEGESGYSYFTNKTDTIPKITMTLNHYGSLYNRLDLMIKRKN